MTQQFVTGVTGGYSKCFHGGVKPIFETARGHTVYAGQEANLYGRYSVILDCSGRGVPRSSLVPPIVRTDADITEQFAGLQDYVQPEAPRIYVAWPDGGAPALDPGFWRALLARLSGDIAVCCLGGHGRTGTALAALWMADIDARGAAEGLAASDAVSIARDKHCRETIETDDQLEYLDEVAEFYGLATDAAMCTPSWELRSWSKPATGNAPAQQTGIVHNPSALSVIVSPPAAASMPATYDPPIKTTLAETAATLAQRNAPRNGHGKRRRGRK